MRALHNIQPPDGRDLVRRRHGNIPRVDEKGNRAAIASACSDSNGVKNAAKAIFVVVSYIVCHQSSIVYAYSSSPKKTLTGSQASPQTLKRSVNPSSFCISSLDKSQPSNSKFFSILA